MQTPGMQQPMGYPQQPMGYPQQQMGYPQQPMMMPFQQPAMVIEVAQPKPVTCDFKECDKPVVDKCFFYSPCGVAGCERNFCQEHAGKRNCLMTRSHRERHHSHGRTYNVRVTDKRPTPCVDCYQKAKKNSVNCWVMLAVFLFSSLFVRRNRHCDKLQSTACAYCTLCQQGTVRIRKSFGFRSFQCLENFEFKQLLEFRQQLEFRNNWNKNW